MQHTDNGRKQTDSLSETKVYTASVDCLADPDLYQKTLALLPAQRRESAQRMKVESGKRLSAGAGLLLMAALADWMSQPQRTDQQEAFLQRMDAQKADLPKAGFQEETIQRTDTQEPDYAGRGLNLQKLPELKTVTFAKGEHGKPYLPDCPQVHFNLSHSGNRVMCVVSSLPCGCDVERVERRQKNIEMVIRCLAESEQRLAAVSAVSFCRIWTLKESILKLSGKGISIPLNSFEVSLEPLAVKQDFMDGPVVLKEYNDYREDYCCACALAGTTPPEKMTEVDLREILT